MKFQVVWLLLLVEMNSEGWSCEASSILLLWAYYVDFGWLTTPSLEERLSFLQGVHLSVVEEEGRS